MPTAAETFEQIIRHESTQELVPFLLALEKKDVVSVRERLLKLWSELDRRNDANGWQAAMTTEQNHMLQLAAIATFAPAQAARPSIRLWFDRRSDHQPEFWQVMEHARPTWLTNWLLPQARSKDTWGVPLHSFVRQLEQRQLLDFEPELFAKTLPNWLPELGDQLSQEDPVSSDANARLVQLLAEDPAVLNRDILLLFEFETHIEKERARIQKRPAPGEDWSGRWQKWNQLHPPQVLDWQEVFVRLITAEYIDRSDILTRCLLALRRDFRRPLLTWFRNLFLTLKPTMTERLTQQHKLAELLPHPQALVANFALEQLTELLPEPEFSLAPLLLYADNLLTRPELKTGLRTLLAGLLKRLKQDAAHASAVARLLATALPHPDSAVQERAAKGLAGMLAAPQPLLTPEETAELLATIGRHAELLGAPARTALAAWLAPVVPADPLVETATYAPAAQFVPELSAATAIVPVADWHELLFLTGQVLRHNDPTATERWLDGLVRLNGQWPAGFAGQLRPYLAQLFPEIKKASDAQIVAILSEPVDVYGHEGLVQAMLLTWATDFAVARVEEADTKRPHVIPNPLLTIEKQRYLLAESLLRNRQALPLLSTPTHQPHWVAPSALVARLLAYQAADYPPDATDLAVALARTAHTHPTDTAEALQQLPALADAGLRELLAWFLGPTDQPLPTLPPAPEQRSPAGSQATVAEALPELWAVAARTKLPAGSFPSLPAALGYEYPGVAQPLRSAFEVVQRENQYPDPEQPDQLKSFHFVELAWDSGAATPAPSPLLVYAPPVGKSKYGSWEANFVMVEDLVFLLSLIPNYPAPLYDQVLRNAAWADNLEATERDLIARALRELLAPGPAFEAAETALLASGLIHYTPLCRSLAQEVLVRAVAQGRLIPVPLGQVLGRQLAVGYAPVPRLATNLEPLLAIDATTGDALRQVLDGLLPELAAGPPRNTGKLLETYASLRGRTHAAMPAAVQARLREWQKSANLKKMAAALLV
jgi:hypothetical protein